MKIRSRIKAFHPSAEMKCLTKGRSDIVAIKRGVENSSIIAIHNITENKLSYSISNTELELLSNNNLIFNDYLTGKKYNNSNIVLEPFQVVWLGL